MSYKKNSSARPLGRLPSPTRDLFADGIIVSSMTVPPLKPLNGALKKPPVVAEVKPISPEQTTPPRNKLSYESLEKQLKEKDKQIKDKDKELREYVMTVKSTKQQISKNQVIGGSTLNIFVSQVGADGFITFCIYLCEVGCLATFKLKLLYSS